MRAANFIVCALLFSIAGCSTFKQYPDYYAEDQQPVDPNKKSDSPPKEKKTSFLGLFRSDASEENEIFNDKDYNCALKRIYEANSDDEVQNIRNKYIEKKLRIIDAHFTMFQRNIAKESVSVNFSANAAQVVVGTIGAVAEEEVSRYMSAFSTILAGGHESFTTAAFFEQTLPVLLAQMIAMRNQILVRISSGMQQDIEKYPLVMASRDLEDYYMAGSIPGALAATAADANEKNTKALAVLKIVRDPDVLNSQLKLKRFLDDSENKESIEQMLLMHNITSDELLTNPSLTNVRESIIDELKSKDQAKSGNNP